MPILDHTARGVNREAEANGRVGATDSLRRIWRAGRERASSVSRSGVRHDKTGTLVTADAERARSTNKRGSPHAPQWPALRHERDRVRVDVKEHVLLRGASGERGGASGEREARAAEATVMCHRNSYVTRCKTRGK
jgi:hypothetical protein